MKLTDLDLRLLPLLDGTRDRAAILNDLVAKSLAGDLKVAKDGQPITDEGEIRTALQSVLEPAINNLAVQSLLAR